MRDLTQRLGLWPFLRVARSVVRGDVRRWLREGCPNPAPGVVKIAIVRSYVKKYRIRRFIETGTFYGAMADAIGRLDVAVDTIELDPDLACRARRIFAARSNIKVHLGDSSKVLPHLLKELVEPAVFWLDAHYSGGITARGEVDSPISRELEAILDHPLGHVILVDDARAFVGRDGYPMLHDLLATVWRTGRYAAEVTTDIVRFVARDVENAKTGSR